jgi:transposase-like protein
MEEPIINKVFPKYTAEQKAAFIEQWKQSGKSQRAFSIEKGLRFQSLNNWILAAKKRLRGFTPEQRVLYVQQWKESGKTQREFCAEHGLSSKSLSNWSVRMKPLIPSESKEKKPQKKKKSKRKRKGFVALKVKKVKSQPVNTEQKVDTTGRVFAEVEIAGRAVISLYREVPAEYLRSIVS